MADTTSEASNDAPQVLSVFDELRNKVHQKVDARFHFMTGIKERNSQRMGSLERARENAEKAIYLFSIIGDKEDLCESTNFLGEVYYALSDPHKALELFKISYDHWEELHGSEDTPRTAVPIKYLVLRGTICRNLATTYQRLDDLANSSKFLQFAMEVFCCINDENGLALCLVDLGVNAYNRDSTEEALEYFFKSLSIRSKLGDEQGRGVCQMLIANCYVRMNQIKEHAISLYGSCANIFTKTLDNVSLGSCLNRVGIAYFKLGDLKSANEFYQKSLRVAESIHDYNGLAKNYFDLSLVETKKNQIEVAIRYCRQSLEIYHHIGSKNAEAKAWDRLGLNYVLKNDLHEAYDCYKQSLNIYRETQFKSGLAKSLFELGKIAKIQNKEEAYKFLKEASTLLQEVQDEEIAYECLTLLADITPPSTDTFTNASSGDEVKTESPSPIRSNSRPRAITSLSINNLSNFGKEEAKESDEQKKHQFKFTHFVSLTFCSYCKTMIFGLARQGYRCQECKYVVHEKCLMLVDGACEGKKQRASTLRNVKTRLRLPTRGSVDIETAKLP